MLATFTTSDTGGRRQVRLPGAETLSIRIEGGASMVRVRDTGGDVLVERATSEHEQTEQRVELTIEHEAFAHWSRFAEVEVSVRTMTVAHHRTADDGGPWRTLGVLLVHSSKPRLALWICTASALLLLLWWSSTLLVGATPMRRALDVVTALFAAAALLPLAGVGRRRAPSVAFATMLFALATSVASELATATVLNAGAPVHRGALSIAHGRYRALRSEVRPLSSDVLLIAHEALARGARCGAEEVRWPWQSRWTPRYLIQHASDKIEIDRVIAQRLGIERAVECDAGGVCCAQPSPSLIEPTPVERGGRRPRVAISAGPSIHQATFEMGALQPLRIRVSDEVSQLAFFDARQTNVELRIDGPMTDTEALIGNLGANWRARASRRNGEVIEVPCASGATRVEEFAAGIDTIDRIEGRDWTLVFGERESALSCHFTEWNDRDEDVTMFVRERPDGQQTSFNARWALVASSVRPAWSRVRLARHRDGRAPEVIATAFQPTRAVRGGHTTLAAQLSEPLHFARSIDRLFAGSIERSWESKGWLRDLALLRLGSAEVDSAQRRQRLRFMVTVVREGREQRVVAGFDPSRAEPTLIELDPSTLPDCCPSGRATVAACDEIEPMLRLPPRRVPLAGPVPPGCRALYELRSDSHRVRR